MMPERIFWEKATILHHEANRPQSSPMPMRYSKHYYDLFCIANSSVKKSAIAKIDLLKKVVDFKIKFYPRSWADYPSAKPGTIKLVLPDFRFDELQKNYNKMKYMLHGEIPTFEKIISGITALEHEINIPPSVLIPKEFFKNFLTVVFSLFENLSVSVLW